LSAWFSSKDAIAMPDADKQLDSISLNEAAEAATAPANAGNDMPPGEIMPSLEELLKASELKAEEHHDAWLRAKAETENVRRRAQDDIAKAGKFASERFAGELLAVKDSLEAALASQNQDAAALRAGVELTLKQLVAAFEKSSVGEINPLDEKFDPHRHQAISQVEADGEPNRVVNVLQKGYALHERILRPALVVVSKARAAAEPPAA
jgi:molecular chaperone GrpE